MSVRFSCTSMLIGEEGLDRLMSSKVAIFGLGGVGSYAVEGLARAGIGNFHLVDFDLVEETNINRQIHALTNTLGRFKTELMAERDSANKSRSHCQHPFCQIPARQWRKPDSSGFRLSCGRH